MIRVSAKVSRGFVSLAAACACACAGSALAAPVGPVVTAGSASYDPATLTVTSATARTQISWQRFNLAAGEVVNFVQPGAHSTVLNQIFDVQSLYLLGDLRSNGSVFLLSNGRVSGAGVNLDLAGAISTSLRLPPLATALSGVASLEQPRPLATLDEGSIYVLGRDEQAVTTAGGDVVLNPGKTVELAHASMPRLRVALTAPDAEAINLSRLVADRRATGIFAGLFRVPAAARQTGRREADTVMTASASDTSDIERFYRYLVLYAQMQRGMEQPGRGLMQVAAVSTSRMFLPAARSRPSLLPRDIEIGASTTRPAAFAGASLPVPAAAEPTQAMPVALARVPEREHELRLVLAPAEPPAELVAMLAPQPIAAMAKQGPARDAELLMALAPVEPPAEMAATLAHHVQAVSAEIAAERGQGSAQRAPAVIVVALADGGAHPVAAAREEPKPKELVIERRAPRYFTDYRGALFFM